MDYTDIFLMNFYSSLGYTLGVIGGGIASVPVIAYYTPSIKRIFSDL